ncbi:MAG: VCBS repeat-containing protein [Planctomycetota bacterium]
MHHAICFFLVVTFGIASFVDAAETTRQAAGGVGWERAKIDDVFRSEGVAVADVNHDGKRDVLAGDVWYEAPDWKMHAIRPVGEYVAGKGYSNSFANFACDVNGDGWDDFIVIGFPGAPFHWYENPKNEPGHWKEHLIWHSACNETPDFEDINGDGHKDIVTGKRFFAHNGRDPGGKDPAVMYWYEVRRQKGSPPTFIPHEITAGRDTGVGTQFVVTDIDGNGRRDIVLSNKKGVNILLGTGTPNRK